MQKTITTDAIFIICQMQKIPQTKKQYFPFINLEKPFYWVPQSVLWWSMRKLGVERRVIWTVKLMYGGVKSSMGKWNVKWKIWGDTKASHSPHCFLLLLWRPCLQIAEKCLFMGASLKCGKRENLKKQLEAWKTSLESHGLRVNVNKTKIYIRF